MGSESLITAHLHHHRQQHQANGEFVEYDAVDKSDCNENSPSSGMEDDSSELNNSIYRKYTMNDGEDDDSSIGSGGCCGRFGSACKGCLFAVFECLFLVF